MIGWGRFEELHGDAAERAEQLLVERMMQLVASAPQPQRGARSEPRRSVIYRIALSERSGRYEGR